MIEALLIGDEEHPPLQLSVDVQDEGGMTPLHWLTVEGHTAVAQWLIDDCSATINAADAKTGQTSLHFAATKGHRGVAEMLLGRDADPVFRDQAGWTPLHAAARSGATDVAAVLLQKLTAAQVNLPGPDGETALHRAAYWGQVDVCSLLVEHGADPTLANDAGRCPQDVACAGGEHPAALPALITLLRPPAPSYS